MGKVCGTYTVPELPCTGSLTLNDISRGTYTFVEQSATNSATCPSGGFEYIRMLSDGTLSWQYLNGSAQSNAILRQP